VRFSLGDQLQKHSDDEGFSVASNAERVGGVGWDVVRDVAHSGRVHPVDPSCVIGHQGDDARHMSGFDDLVGRLLHLDDQFLVVRVAIAIAARDAHEEQEQNGSGEDARSEHHE